MLVSKTMSGFFMPKFSWWTVHSICLYMRLPYKNHIFKSKRKENTGNDKNIYVICRDVLKRRYQMLMLAWSDV